MYTQQEGKKKSKKSQAIHVLQLLQLLTDKHAGKKIRQKKTNSRWRSSMRNIRECLGRLVPKHGDWKV